MPHGVLPLVLPPVLPVISLRANLVVAPLLTDPAGCVGQKEELLLPQLCRQGWRFSSNHLTSL